MHATVHVHAKLLSFTRSKCAGTCVCWHVCIKFKLSCTVPNYVIELWRKSFTGTRMEIHSNSWVISPALTTLPMVCTIFSIYSTPRHVLTEMNFSYFASYVFKITYRMITLISNLYLCIYQLVLLREHSIAMKLFLISKYLNLIGFMFSMYIW